MHEKSRSDRQARRSDRKKSKKKKKSRSNFKDPGIIADIGQDLGKDLHIGDHTPLHLDPIIPDLVVSHHNIPAHLLDLLDAVGPQDHQEEVDTLVVTDLVDQLAENKIIFNNYFSYHIHRDRKSSSKRSLEKPQILTPEEQLKQKMQKALKAAADADAQLRGIGALEPKNEPESELPASLSISSQISRANAIEEISSTEFRPRNFVSSRGAPKHEEESSGHETAIFGKAIVSTDIGSTLNTNVLILDENNLADEKLFLNVDKKKERWLKKLAEMRKSILSSN
ncbi:Serine/Arginine-related protein 53 [Nymphon striatum]|nr:Serine/Arginine-related protein 53 [Nymphon striatum]